MSKLIETAATDLGLSRELQTAGNELKYDYKVRSGFAGQRTMLGPEGAML